MQPFTGNDKQRKNKTKKIISRNRSQDPINLSFVDEPKLKKKVPYLFDDS